MQRFSVQVLSVGKQNNIPYNHSTKEQLATGLLFFCGDIKQTEVSADMKKPCLGEKHGLGMLLLSNVLSDEVFAGHVCGLLEAHDVEDCGCNIGEDAVGNLGVGVSGHIHTWNGVE